MNGYCVFDDLNCHLPPSLSSISISLTDDCITSIESVASLLELTERLADVNAYPNLEEVHLQFWSTRCAERLLNHVANYLPNLRRLSVIAMPVVQERSCIIDLIRHVASSCRRLLSLKLSAEMLKLLLNEYGDLWRSNWRMAISLLAKECKLRDSCELSADHLPHTSGWDDYVVIPDYLKDFSPLWSSDGEQFEDDEDKESSEKGDDETKWESIKRLKSLFIDDGTEGSVNQTDSEKLEAMKRRSQKT
ncbi:hypothetical protein KIN20_004379 [Parelaphostrongylus tenuis]|uniref:Uncharacterized protein n=1 Tax=Parelaphostrongylus tenuis TaxID=148309 RepID=A0AAD5M1M3_PARTN|nr:hypothetical protein KIN20_004379 [Parelaphostrongylus tenuis]